MTRSGKTVTKRVAAASSRAKKPKSSQSVVTSVCPEAVERLAAALTRLACYIDRPGDSVGLSDGETGGEAARKLRDRLGSEYVAAIAEQRPGVADHGYPGGQPDWDQQFRLKWSGYTKVGEFIDDMSAVLPYWMALPLVRRLVLAAKERLRDEPDKSDDSAG